MANSKIAAEVVIFNQETAEISIERVVDVEADMLETSSAIYHLSTAKTYVDSKRQRMVYAFNVDLPAKVEASNLKTLRRSVTLKHLFNFERSTGGIKWSTFLPYMIIVLMILFK